MYKIIKIPLIFFFFFLFSPIIFAEDFTLGSVTASSILSGWDDDNLIDGDTSTVWSSKKKSLPTDSVNVAFWFDTYHETNYIKIYPRYTDSGTLSFPLNLKVSYYDGTSWIPIETLTLTDTSHPFPTPASGWIILPFGKTVTANGLRVYATYLGHDEDDTDYYFQLAEVGGGYEEGFEDLKFTGTTASSSSCLVDAGHVLITGVGAGPFNPNKISNWNYQYGGALISSDCSSKPNIYAPHAEWVENESKWYIFYGGWDQMSGETKCTTHDRLYRLYTDEDFQSFTDKTKIIDPGSYFLHTNNLALARESEDNWAMVYTAAYCDDFSTSCPDVEKQDYTAYALSTDGGKTWLPDDPGHPAGANSLIKIDGSTLGDNGENALLYDGGVYQYYYTGWLGYSALSTDMINFTGNGAFATGDGGTPRYCPTITEFATNKAVNDIKKFSWNGDNYYLLLSHHNEAEVYYSLSTDSSFFPENQILFSSSECAESSNCSIAPLCTNSGGTTYGCSDAPTECVDPEDYIGGSGYGDQYIVSAGIVSDGSDFFGVLYGASATSSLNNNKIFAAWLQKKVLFDMDSGGTRGEIERGNGPNQIIFGLERSDEVSTGTFSIYDTDGTTKLFTSPDVTIFSGMCWEYVDSDRDGLGDTAEASLGTDPDSADSDGDGLYDNDEVALETSPIDTDSDDDGLSDGAEVKLGTNPLVDDIDTDKDGLTDSEENSLGTYPSDPDSDDDDLSDGDEVNTYATDPLDSDSDNDGLSDGKEIEEGSDPNVYTDWLTPILSILMEGDEDGDTYDSEEDGGDDCDDEDSSVYPGATETCGDGIDQDCDGVDTECVITYTVTKTADTNDGKCTESDCSLREAMAVAKADTSGYKIDIVFDISSTDTGCNITTGLCTISPTKALPALNRGNTVIDGEGLIVVDGTSAGSTTKGFTINNSSSNVIANIGIQNFGSHGIYITGSSSSENEVSGCYIGTDFSETDQSNGGSGIYIASGSATISKNVIAYNLLKGIHLTSTSTLGVVITQNSLHDNVSTGIVLASGANNSKTKPVITTATVSGSTVTITGTATAGDTIEIFNASTDSEGQTYIGETTADSSGTWAYTTNTTTAPKWSKIITTATDTTNGTSQFSSTRTVK